MPLLKEALTVVPVDTMWPLNAPSRIRKVCRQCFFFLTLRLSGLTVALSTDEDEVQMQKDHRKTQNHNQENNQQNYQPEDQKLTFGHRLFSSHPDAGVVSWQQKKTHTIVKLSVLDDLNR